MVKPWADQPFHLISTPTAAEHPTVSATLAHNLILRNMNAIYLQAPNVTLLPDISDFLVFCQIWQESIHHHHSAEERIFFPEIEKYTGEKGLMEANVKQHHDFEEGLETFREYVFGTKPQEYDAEVLLGIIDSFGAVVTTHLNDEIPTLLGLDKYGGAKLSKTWQELDKRVVKEIKQPERILPFGLGGLDVTYESGRHKDWPPFPWFVLILSKFWFSRKHKGSWRFSPCSMDRKPRELEFVKDDRPE